MNKTNIEWVKNPDGSQGYTWNPITGCLNHINGMCKGGNFPCYAHKLANGRLKERYLANRQVADVLTLAENLMARKYNDPFYPRFWPERLPFITTKPRGIFVCDMSDLFGIGIPEEWTRQVLMEIEIHPRHRFYLLTKQPQNLIKWSPFPDNCWVGVTAIQRQHYWDALTYLSKIEANKRFISFEPLLESIEVGDGIKYIDWAILGTQTNPLKRILPEWIRDITEAAHKYETPVFHKDNLRVVGTLCIILNNEQFQDCYGVEFIQEMPR